MVEPVSAQKRLAIRNRPALVVDEEPIRDEELDQIQELDELYSPTAVLTLTKAFYTHDVTPAAENYWFVGN